MADKHAAGIFCFLGLLATVVFAWLTGSAHGGSAERQHHVSRHYEQEARTYIAETCSRLPTPRLADCIADQIQTTEAEKRAERELTAQESAARSATFAVWIAFVSLLATLAALGFLKGTLDATRQAVGQAADGTQAALLAAKLGHEANELTRRNWLSEFRPVMLLDEVTWEPGDAFNHGTTFRLKWKNEGKLPAVPISLATYRIYEIYPQQGAEDVTAALFRKRLLDKHPVIETAAKSIVPSGGLYPAKDYFIYHGRLNITPPKGAMLRVWSAHSAIVLGTFRYGAVGVEGVEWESEVGVALTPVLDNEGRVADYLSIPFPAWLG